MKKKSANLAYLETTKVEVSLAFKVAIWALGKGWISKSRLEISKRSYVNYKDFII